MNKKSDLPAASALSKRNTLNCRPDDWNVLAEQLGRPPTGFQEVVRRNKDGLPVVVRVASVVNGEPFPTLYWLSEKRLTDLIYTYESRGIMNRVQQLIDDSEDFQRQMIRDNEDHIRERTGFFDETTRRRLIELGIEGDFNSKGIGGNANFLRVRCLHAYLAAHLVRSNIVGSLMSNLLGPEDPLVNLLGQVH